MRACATLVVTALSLLAPARADGPGVPLMAGEVIVKFADKSEAGALLARAAGGQPRAAAELVTLAARLSTELAVPLAAGRVTSGRELVLHVRRDELQRMIVERVMQDAAVRDVHPAGGPTMILPASEIVVVVELVAGSDAQQRIASAAQAGLRTGAEVDGLVARLGAGSSAQMTGRVNDRGQLELVIDVAALTLDVVQRLRRRSDVEYAQVIQILQPFGVPGSTPH